jgi:hypothetical protein
VRVEIQAWVDNNSYYSKIRKKDYKIKDNKKDTKKKQDGDKKNGYHLVDF